MLRVDDAIGVWVALLFGESCASKEGEANAHISHVQQGELKTTVPATAQVLSRPMGGAVLLLLLIERPLEKGLLSEIILLLSEMRGDVRNRWSNSKGLV